SINTLMNFTTETPSSSSSSAAGGSCEKDMVDLMFIIDTSASVQKEFYAEKNFALDLVRVLPEQDFTKRISIAMVKFRGTADIHFHFHPGRRREDIIYDIERVEHTGGETSLATAAELAYREIFRLRRPEARLIVVIITDGNSQDEWKDVKVAAKKLRASTGGNGIYAVTLSEKYSVEELREYTGTEDNLYTNHRIDQFIQEVGNSISRCPDGERDGIKVTPVPDVEASTTPSSTSMLFDLMNSTATQLQDKQVRTKIGQPKKHNKEDEVAKARDEVIVSS
uniref:VWFA domain-containing protein n=1 Tax=Globodera pallida TaxID=36090 RepID=A0A183CN51_GLOPA